jgi:PAS domain-containing protein
VSHVLSSIDQYERLTSSQDNTETPELTLFGLADWLDDGIFVCDRDGRLLYANRVAKAIARLDDIVGDVPLADLVPSVRGTLFEVHYRRTLIGCEPTSADLPSPFRDDGWLHLRSFPLRNNIVLLFRDITEDVQRHRLADVKETIIEGMAVQGRIGYLRISLRGTIDRADKVFCDWIGLPEDRLVGAVLLDLVEKTERVTFREALDKVLDGAGSQNLDAAFLPNHEGIVRVRCGIAQLKGAYGAEGAVLLCTRVD